MAFDSETNNRKTIMNLSSVVLHETTLIKAIDCLEINGYYMFLLDKVDSIYNIAFEPFNYESEDNRLDFIQCFDSISFEECKRIWSELIMFYPQPNKYVVKDKPLYQLCGD